MERGFLTEFLTFRARDAWAIIRGYVYQVEMTIMRWLDLADEELLELERGEDIDIVQTALNGVEEVRLLEQVKRLETNITLRDPVVLKALACFYEHSTSNPGKRLKFRFLTTAKRASERQSPFYCSMPALEAWELIRCDKLVGGQLREKLAGIRSIIASAPRPNELPEGTWQSFVSFVSEHNDTSLVAFIRVSAGGKLTPWRCGQKPGLK